MSPNALKIDLVRAAGFEPAFSEIFPALCANFLIKLHPDSLRI